MRTTVGLPAHRVDAVDEFLTAAAIGDLARTAEAAGFDAMFVTEHPFPADAWLATGGHHALDPFVALSFIAAATTRLRLHTNLFVAPYRNPFLAAKAVASLDVVSGGRVVLGIGAGYPQGEFAALGAPFDDRNDRVDEALRAMKAAWSGESVTFDGTGYRAAGNTMRPPPAQRPHPPLWIGGNSKRAIRRAVELADGWSPFPNPARFATRQHTASIGSLHDLRDRVTYAAEYAAEVGRTEPLEVVFMPFGLTMMHRERTIDPAKLVDEIHELADAGVTYLAVSLNGDTRADVQRAITAFGDDVLSAIASL